MRAAAVLGGQLVASSATGYAFQKVFAYYYGASATKSIFDIAFAVPTMLIYLSGFGLTHAIVVSLFTRLRKQECRDMDRVFSTLLNASVLVLFVLIAGMALAAPVASRWLAPGFSQEEQQQIELLILWMLPLAFTFGVSSFLSAISTAWRIPVGQEILLASARTAVILYLLVVRHATPITRIAAILLGTTLLSLAIQWVAVRRTTGLRYRLVLELGDVHVQEAVHQFGGFAIVALTAQFAGIYWRRVGTLAGPDIVALLGYGFSIVDPVGSIVGKLAAFQFGQPLVADLSSGIGRGELVRRVRRLLLAAFLVGTLSATAIALSARTIVGMLFSGGVFGEADVLRTASLLRILALGLPGAVVLWAVLYPLLAKARHSAAIMYIAGYLVQIALIHELFAPFGAIAIPVSYVACLSLQAVLGMGLLYQWMSRIPRPATVSAS